jgi:hypothetical protein
MKIYGMQVIPARKEKKLVLRKCDLCGRESKYADWSTGNYEVDETEIAITIVHKKGESYPEASFGKTMDIDLCPVCFKDKLIPWLKEEGATINEEEWDY